MSERHAENCAQLADVLVPVAVDQPYSYRVPDGMRVAEGDFVKVSLGSRARIGVVWALRRGPSDKLKPVTERLDLPPLAAKFRALLDWIAAWTMAPRGMVLRMATRPAEGAEDQPLRIAVRATGASPKRPTPARARVLAALPGELSASKSELARLAGVSTGVVDALIDDGALEAIALPPETPGGSPDPDFCAPLLSPAQEKAARDLREAVGVAGVQAGPAGRRHRLRQDGSLFRGGGPGFEGRRPGPDPDAGNRPHGAVSRTFRQKFRPTAGGMAFRPVGAPPGAHLARRRRRRGQGGRRRPFGFVPALQGLAADRGR